MDDSITQTTICYDKYIFTTTDCLGNPIALKHKTFYDKIVPYHPEVTIDNIIDGIESAKHVRRDIRKNRLCYYKPIKTKIAGKHNPKNIKVVAEIIPNVEDYREIVTSYVFGPKDLNKELTRGEIIYDAKTTSTS